MADRCPSCRYPLQERAAVWRKTPLAPCHFRLCSRCRGVVPVYRRPAALPWFSPLKHCLYLMEEDAEQGVAFEETPMEGLVRVRIWTRGALYLGEYFVPEGLLTRVLAGKEA